MTLHSKSKIDQVTMFQKSDNFFEMLLFSVTMAYYLQQSFVCLNQVIHERKLQEHHEHAWLTMVNVLPELGSMQNTAVSGKQLYLLSEKFFNLILHSQMTNSHPSYKSTARTHKWSSVRITVICQEILLWIKFFLSVQFLNQSHNEQT